MRLALLITKGFRDAVKIGYQNFPDLFALNIVLAELLQVQCQRIVRVWMMKGLWLMSLN